MAHILWTIGHSTHPIEEFLALLRAHGIRQLVDVRTIPRSRHNPQFNTEALARSLADAAISYQHSARLGGLRKTSKDSMNTGWRNESFRGYADYMQTHEFRKSLDELIADSRKLSFSPAHPGRAETRPFRVAIMCAEAVPWRCHRSLIADALVMHGSEVRHIMTTQQATLHRLTSFAKIEKGLLFYPKMPETASLF